MRYSAWVYISSGEIPRSGCCQIWYKEEKSWIWSVLSFCVLLSQEAVAKWSLMHRTVVCLAKDARLFWVLLEESPGLAAPPGQSKKACSDPSLGLRLGFGAAIWMPLQVRASTEALGKASSKGRSGLFWLWWVSALGYLCTDKSTSQGEKTLQIMWQRMVPSLIRSSSPEICFCFTDSRQKHAVAVSSLTASSAG